MGFVLRVTQDVSMYRYLWGSSQATMDPSTSPPSRPLHPVQGSLIGLQKRPVGCHCRVVICVTVTLGLPFVSVKLTSPWSSLAPLHDVSRSIKSLSKIPLSTVITQVFWNDSPSNKVCFSRNRVFGCSPLETSHLILDNHPLDFLANLLTYS